MEKIIKQMRCPLCERMLMRISDTSHAELEVKCSKCKNILEVKIDGNNIEFKNDKIQITKTI